MGMVDLSSQGKRGESWVPRIMSKMRRLLGLNRQGEENGGWVPQIMSTMRKLLALNRQGDFGSVPSKSESLRYRSGIDIRRASELGSSWHCAFGNSFYEIPLSVYIRQ